MGCIRRQAVLSVEQSALTAVEKSAEGVVGGWLH
jgi:hypothetical protein